MFVVLWPTSLSMRISRSIHAAVDGIISFSVTNTPSHVCATSSLHTPPPAEEDVYDILAVVNNAAVNTGVCVSFRISFLQIDAQELDCWILSFYI